MNKNGTNHNTRLPARPLTGFLSLCLLALIMLVDAAQSLPIDPYLAPAPVALGSGMAPQGAHCTNLP